MRLWRILTLAAVVAACSRPAGVTPPAATAAATSATATQAPATQAPAETAAATAAPPTATEGAPAMTGAPEATSAPPTAAATPDPACAAGETHALALSIAARYEVTAEQVMAWYCAGSSFEDILLALETSLQSGAPADELLAMRAEGRDWNDIWRDIGLMP
jgi:hypothetical protein